METFYMLFQTDADIPGNRQNSTGNTSNDSALAAKIAQANETKFRNDSDKFEGRLGSSYDDTIATYN